MADPELSAATRRWTARAVTRTYERDKKGQDRLQRELAALASAGYEPVGQSETDGHVHVGRLLLTGGWSVLAGSDGVRSRGALTITFVKRSHPFASQPETSRRADSRAQLDWQVQKLDEQIATVRASLAPGEPEPLMLADLREARSAFEEGDATRALAAINRSSWPNRRRVSGSLRSKETPTSTAAHPVGASNSPQGEGRRTLADRLADLDDAYAKSLISADEYASKRGRMLGDL